MERVWLSPMEIEQVQFVARQEGQGGQNFNRYNNQGGFNANAMPRQNAQQGAYQPYG